MEYRGWRIDLIDESKEKCWIGLQEEIGGAIKACTCHRFGGFHGVGVYLNNMVGFRRPKQLQANVEKLRAIVGMRDVVPIIINKIHADGFWIIDDFEPVNPGFASDESNKELEDFDAFFKAFFKDPSIDYAYVFTFDVDRKYRRVVANLMKIPFDYIGYANHITRLDFTRKG